MIKKGLFPIGGIVPYEGELYTIVNRYGDAQTCFYGLRQRSSAGAPRTHVGVLGSRLQAEIEAFAKFNLGDRVLVDNRGYRYPILRRRWSFRSGEVFYGLGEVNKLLFVVHFKNLPSSKLPPGMRNARTPRYRRAALIDDLDAIGCTVQRGRSYLTPLPCPKD